MTLEKNNFYLDLFRGLHFRIFEMLEVNWRLQATTEIYNPRKCVYLKKRCCKVQLESTLARKTSYEPKNPDKPTMQAPVFLTVDKSLSIG